MKTIKVPTNPKEVKDTLRARVEEINQRTRENFERIRKRSSLAKDIMTKKILVRLEEMLLEAERKLIKEYKNWDESEVKANIMKRLREHLDKLEEKEHTPDEIEKVATDIVSELGMLWFHRDYMIRKIKEGRKQNKEE